MALFAGAFAAPNVRSKLAQQNSKNLAEIEEAKIKSEGDIELGPLELPDICTCNFTQLPVLGAGL